MPLGLARPPNLPTLPDSRPVSPLAAFADVLRPRKARLRTTALALLSLVLLSAYILLVAQPSLSPPPLPLRRAPAAPAQAPIPAPDHQDSWAQLLAKYRQQQQDSPVQSHPPLVLDTSQQLAALTAFMAALPQNVLPHDVDPSAPLDPQLVLDFDTRASNAAQELDDLVHDVWRHNPVVVFSKMRSPVSRELKGLLNDLKLRPAPTVFEVDQRDDAAVLIPLLHRLTGIPELPILLVAGTPVGTISAVRALAASGELRALVGAAGAELDGAARRKKKGRRS